MDRSASAVWHGDLRSGNGTISTQTGTLKEAQYSFKSRFEDGTGTNPEELIAAAHAGCFSMAFSNQLATAGHVAESIATTAVVTMVPVDGKPTVTTIHLTCEGKVAGIEAAEFDKIAHMAEETCPISRLLKGAEIILDAKLLA